MKYDIIKADRLGEVVFVGRFFCPINHYKRRNIMEKWTKAAIPALLIHCSIGTVYCWSTFKEAIAEHIGESTFAVGWAFSLAIFFLGMSAAFAGRLVEKDVHRSSLISCLCFTGGMLGTGACTQFLTGTPALIGIYLCYGVLMGIGLGVGYISPVKTIMLWFSENKGLATGISIMGFGLAKAIATPVMEALQKSVGISGMFYVLGIVYFIMMFVGHLLLAKPKGWVEPDTRKNDSHILLMFKNKTFTGIWLMFFINIHCGLMLITYEKQLLGVVFAATAILGTIVSTIPSVTAASNALGRIGYATLSDKMKDRNTVYSIFFISCIVITLISIPCFFAVDNIPTAVFGIIVIVLLIIINAGYGGGFATLPALLSQRFGMEKVSQIHGLTLTAWAIAGLTGNNMSELILEKTGSYSYVLCTILVLYLIAFIISQKIVKERH